MGRNKLLMPFEGGTVIGRTLDNLMASDIERVLVVVGSCAPEMVETVSRQHVTMVFNPGFAKGMSTSLTCGLSLLGPQQGFVMVVLGDQPLVSTATYNRLITAAKAADKGIIVPVYRRERGNPILIHSSHIPEILNFTGDVGGRELLKKYPHDVLEIPVNDRGVVANINTQEEYRRYIKPRDSSR
jgi:molybdenum cofactor cytidylyltransferase